MNINNPIFDLYIMLISKNMFRLPTAYCVLSTIILLSCSSPTESDLIVHHGKIYTVDDSFSIVEAMAIKDGKILAIGTNEKILAEYKSANTVDCNGSPVYPGIIDAHCHFLGYGLGLSQVDLVGTKSFKEVIQRVVEFTKSRSKDDTTWVMGRGWDQNDWEVKEYPTRRELDSLFPNTPVILKRIDGHAALINAAALGRAKIDGETKVSGGEILCVCLPAPLKDDGKGGWICLGPHSDPTGILIDNAVDLVTSIIPPPSEEQLKTALLNAQKNCFAAGITTVDDAGLLKREIDVMDKLHKSGELKMRIYAMLSDTSVNYDHYLQYGPYKTERLNIRSFKFYGDGALGSRGACLLQPYADKPGQSGFLLRSAAYYKEKAQLVYDRGFQVNTHCIGDSANRLILDIYGEILKGTNDKRWRIEHAQVVHKDDLHKFKDFSVIPSIQPTHATSDMYWAGERLGPVRVKNAYAYFDLKNAYGMVALGTDFPVENINPMFTFYAAVARKDLKNFPENGFQMENALSREDALRGMTIWAAFANFEEKEKGSLVPGRFADFILLDKDIMTCDVNDIPKTRVLSTFVGGENVHFGSLPK
jgi:predicted amidohydrolase YtcJ